MAESNTLEGATDGINNEALKQDYDKSTTEKGDFDTGFVNAAGYIVPKDILPLIGKKKRNVQGGGEGGMYPDKTLVDLIKKYQDYKVRLGEVTDRVLNNALDQLDFLRSEAGRLAKQQTSSPNEQSDGKQSKLTEESFIFYKKERTKSSYKDITKGKNKNWTESKESMDSKKKQKKAEFTNYKMNFGILVDPKCLDEKGCICETKSYRLEFSKETTKMEPCPLNYVKGETSLHFGQLKTENSLYDVYLKSENLSSVLFVLGTCRRPKKGTINVSLVRVGGCEVEQAIAKDKKKSMEASIEAAIERSKLLGLTDGHVNYVLTAHAKEKEKSKLTSKENQGSEEQEHSPSFIERLLAFWKNLFALGRCKDEISTLQSSKTDHSVSAGEPSARSSISIMSIISKTKRNADSFISSDISLLK